LSSSQSSPPHSLILLSISSSLNQMADEGRARPHGAALSFHVYGSFW
jgi:hypothetical protein